MVRNMLVVAALLLTNLAGNAAAAEDPEHPSKNAQKLIATLNTLGLNSPEVREFVEDINSHVKNGYFNFAQQEMLGGEFALRYRMRSSEFDTSKRLELSYTPEDSHTVITAQTNGIRVNYRLKF